jgi:hypothetical protein
MRLSTLASLSLLSSFLALPALPQIAPATGHSFRVEGDHFALDGKPFRVLAGEMHYARVPRAYWRDRLRKAKAMGLNTITTYVFWNVHEPEPGKYDFSGNNDVAEFVREAQQEGLYVNLRPGPYSCAEWEFGGFSSMAVEGSFDGGARQRSEVCRRCVAMDSSTGTGARAAADRPRRSDPHGSD